MAATMFSKEVSRFALMSKKECLQDLLNNGTFAPSDDGYKTIESKIEEIDKELAAVGKQRGSKNPKSSEPRPMNVYNKFVKAKLPEIAKEHPELDNRARMKQVSEIWKTMTPEEKAAYNN